MFDSYPKIPINEEAFSGMTFRVRYPKILTDVIQSELFDQRITQELENLKQSLNTQLVDRLSNTTAAYWHDFYVEYEGKKLIDLPFFDAEVYLFALINSIVQYDTLQIDPYSKIKSADLSQSQLAFDRILASSKDWDTKDFILNNLHGNKSDLSQLVHGDEVAIEVILDDSQTLIGQLPRYTSTEIILDNTGMELFSDLLLVDHLIDKYDHQITLHIKAAPLFVSDVIDEDITKLLDFLSHHQEEFVQRIKTYIKQGKITIVAHNFWNSPGHFDTIPKDLISKESLLLSKGDANYRRFFGDRILDSATNAFELTSYLKNEAFAIRTLKSDIQTSLSTELVQSLNSRNKEWRNIGKFAVIQKVSARILKIPNSSQKES
ncbi:damage-control phosphatase ARMT1 family protein [Reichenbachiella ulvae]|uniref:Damage-control phosphatase ARMT1 family protein n=1 Tax=Reichenbachiella ulvae TaxID=2980104 RepID=A0ABT3CQ09_9BACT|nr:damage-control phosphatase ARMT1 family protein [Reichenbachiella ulvae]MCV9385545.1 damage-control phosphatase ARMT1 family protein [Reichenbachiella ulvae]